MASARGDVGGAHAAPAQAAQPAQPAAGASRPRTFAPGKHAPGLRIASHNIRGFKTGKGGDPWAHLHALVTCWLTLNLHVICVQETHLRSGAEPGRAGSPSDVEHQLQQAATAKLTPGYTAFWAHNTQSAGRGVGVLIRSDLIGNGSLQVHTGRIRAMPDGRLLAVPVSLSGPGAAMT